jgi:hypothetical protein
MLSHLRNGGANAAPILNAGGRVLDKPVAWSCGAISAGFSGRLAIGCVYFIAQIPKMIQINRECLNKDKCVLWR